MRCIGVLLAVFLAVAGPRPAAARSGAPAKPLVVTLEYDAPETCPQVGEFKAIVVKRLGRDPFVEEAPDRVSVVVWPTDDALTAKLIWRESALNRAGEHTFPSRTNHCAEVIGAIGFALALQIQLLEMDGAAAQAPDGRTSELGSTPSAATAPRRMPRSPEPPVQHALPEQRRLPPRVSVGVGAAIVSGISSRLVPTARLFTDLRWTFAAVELGAEASAPVTTRREDGGGVSQWNLLSTAAGCGLIDRWRGCMVVKAGMVHVAGRDVDLARSANAALVQGGLRLAWSQKLSARAYLSLRGEGLVNLTRWSVTLDHVPVWSAPRLALASGLDFVVLFR
ncbi:MAG: hypothetical protein ABI488_02210 [Polyangiaceae bacterium]